MKRSTDRILSTHVGSLPRPPEIAAAMLEHRASGPAFDEQVKRAVADVVKQQAASGIDIPSDGEMSKLGFSNYVDERITGFEARPGEHFRVFGGRDRKAFPEFYKILDQGATVGRTFGAMVCTGPIQFKGAAVVKRDLDNFKSALANVSATEAFVPAIAPGTVALQRRNAYYKSDEEFLFAIAEALAPEYQAIVEAGFVLQIDDPRMVTEYDTMEPEPSIAEYQKLANVRVDAINHAIAGLPADRIRYHVCWGSWHGPHSTDVALKHLLPVIFRLKVGGFSVEAANPQHAHEWEVFETHKLPAGMVLIPGVIAHTTNHVEHPEYIAQRLVQYAKVAGRENVIAGSDCGFAQGADIARVHPSIMWAKFRNMAEGARLATKKLWGR
jgi:5-methyltetrahydropteroyltriglutamate--homocysteine methyltransferase